MMTRSDRARNAWFAAVVAVALMIVPLAAFAKPVAKDEAATAVRGWLRHPGHGLKTPLGNAVGNIEVYADAAGDPLYFIVNLQPSGFVIVPADDLVEPILCFCPAGKYVASDRNPLGALVMSDVPGRLALARAKPAADPQPHQAEARRRWGQFRTAAPATASLAGLSSVSDVRVPPLIQSLWDQGNAAGGNCYNYYTPNHDVDGCVATAMAQLMRFYQYPTAGVGTASFSIYVNGNTQTASLRGGNGSGGAYDWTNMPLVPANGLTTVQRQAIGALCYDAGVSVHMQYTANSSGAYPTDVVPALLNVFLFHNAICGGNGGNVGSGLNGMLNPNLDAGFPCLLSIRDSTGAAGHEIVADGYGYDSSTLYHHLNLGWSGYADAWYNLPGFNAGGYNWQSVNFCVYNVYPAGSGEIISGRVTDSSGAAISGATVTATRAAGGTYTATTNTNGIYAFAKAPSASSYTLTAAQTGYTFSTQHATTGTSANYNSASGNVWSANFVGTAAGGTQTLTVNSSPIQGVAITGTQPGATNYSVSALATGSAVNLTAPATVTSNGTRYNFVQWAVPTGWTATAATVSGTLDANAALEADYAAQMWTLSVNSTPMTGVAISSTTSQGGATNYTVNATDGTAVNLSVPASDPSGYTFVDWKLTANGATTTNTQRSLNFTLSNNTTAVAEYQTAAYILTVQSSPVSGVTLLSSTGQAGTTTYTKTLADGTAVILTAPPAFVSGATTYNFVQWTAPAGWTVSGATVSGVIHAATTLEADYAAQAPWTLAVQAPTGSGTTTPATGNCTYAVGTPASVQANAAAGWNFDHWTGDAVAAGHSTDNPLSVASGTSGQIQNVAATFVQPPPILWTLNVASTPSQGIAINGTYNGTTDYTASSVPNGTAVTLTVPSNDPTGTTFQDWKVMLTGQSPITITQRTATFSMTANATATAEYRVTGILLTVQSAPITGVSITSTTGQPGMTNYVQSVTAGTAVNLNAPSTDPSGYTFVSWQLNGTAKSTGKKALNFTMTAASTAIAQYKPVMCVLNVQSTPMARIEISSPSGQSGRTNYSKQNLAYRASVTLTAPATNPAKYVFSKWTLNGTAQPQGQKTITFDMNTKTITAVAQYALVTYPLTVQSTPVNGIIVASGTANGNVTNYNQDVATGSRVYLRAQTTDPAGYVFSRWTRNGTPQPAGQKALTFTMAGPTTAVAEYRSTQR
jgi:hypothetical protein